MTRTRSLLQHLLLLLLVACTLAVFGQQVHAVLPELTGYDRMELDSALEGSFVNVTATPSAYADYVTKRLCVSSVDKAFQASYAIVQLAFHITGCDVRDGLVKLKILPSRTNIDAALGRCSAAMKKVCTPVAASIEVKVLSKWQIVYTIVDTVV